MNYGIANNNGQVEKNEAMSILEFAYRVGIDTLDTAKGYGCSEEIIGKYLEEHNNEVWSIVTKIKNQPDDDEIQEIHSINKMRFTPKIVLAHSAADYLKPSFCNKLHQLKELKGVNQVGVSVYTSGEIQNVLSGIRPDVIQCPLNILDTRLYRNGILDKIKEEGIDIHIRSVFLQGLFYLSNKKLLENFSDVLGPINQLKIIAQDAGLTIAELSLLWVTSLDQVDKIIIGVDTVEQLKVHQNTLDKKVDSAIFEKALSIKYENEMILNPRLWL